MRTRLNLSGRRIRTLLRGTLQCAAGALVAAIALHGQGPDNVAASTPVNTAPPTATPAQAGLPAADVQSTLPSNSDRRHAVKLYLDSSKLYMNSQFEEAMQGFQKASALDPSNASYRLAADVARSHAVTALVQAAAKDRLRGDDAAARAALAQALALDPNNFAVNQHIDELAKDALLDQPVTLTTESSAGGMGEEEPLEPVSAAHSFHLRSDQRLVIQQIYQAYGVVAMIDDSVRPQTIRVDVDNATFAQAERMLRLLTNTFTVTLDPHHAIIAADTPPNRERLMRQQMETIALSGMSDAEMTDVESLAQKVFNISQAKLTPSEHTITLRAPALTLNAFNTTMRSLLDGQSQVMLDVRMIQVAHTSTRNTGAQLPQSISAFNVYAEEQSILNANQSLVNEIISSGLASRDNPLAILAILIASGQVSSSLFSNGFALFGGGLTQSALAPGAATLNLNLNTSDSRELDQILLRLQDGDEGTLKEGSRYPIQTSSYSSLSSSSVNIPGLTSAGSSSSLSSLLASLTSSIPNIPMVQYQDLGLTLTTTPRVLRNGDVALSIDMKLDSLSGATLDGNPILNSRTYKGVVTLKEGEAAVVATEVDKSESRAVSGTPGITEIPGMNNLTDKDVQKNYATLVIVMTPHVVRGTQAAGHTPMLWVDKDTATR